MPSPTAGAPVTPVTTEPLTYGLPPRPSPQAMANFNAQADAIAAQYQSSAPGLQPSGFDRNAFIQARASGVGVDSAKNIALGLERAPQIPPLAQRIAPTTVTSEAAKAAGAGTAAKGTTGILSTGNKIVDKILGNVALPATLAGAAYFMTPEVKEEEERVAALAANNPQRLAYERWQSIQDKNSPEALAEFEKWYGRPAYTSTQLASSFGANPLPGITSSGATPAAASGVANLPTGAIGPGLGIPVAAAAGGEIVGPGTGTSDSIPAMLSDGEFVMTAKAVRNAGNGDRDLGAARMYDMMNRFERGTA